MHQPALRLRLRYQLWLHCYSCNIHVRPLSSAGGVPVASSDQKAIEILEPWQDNGANAHARKEKGAKDIIVDDVAATLEAHRASNRATVYANEKSSKRLVRNIYSEKGNGAADVTHIWPANSVQARERYGDAFCKELVKRDGPLEYIGSLQWPKGPWKIIIDDMEMQIQRPWLAYLKTTNEDNIGRFVLRSHQRYR